MSANLYKVTGDTGHRWCIDMDRRIAYLDGNDPSSAKCSIWDVIYCGASGPRLYVDIRRVTPWGSNAPSGHNEQIRLQLAEERSLLAAWRAAEKARLEETRPINGVQSIASHEAACNTPEALARQEALRAEWERAKASGCVEAWKLEELGRKVQLPHLDYVRNMVSAHYNYREDFEACFDTEWGTAHLPAPPEVELSELRGAYPREAMWVEADDYTLASHHLKCAAGRRALAVIESGGPLEEARAILDNWAKDCEVL